MPRRLASPLRRFSRLFRQPLAQCALASAFLFIDFHAGALFIQSPVLFIFPVALSAWYSGWKWASFLAVFQPAVRFGFTFIWPVLWSTGVSLINFGLRASVLLLIVYLIQRTARQTRELSREVKLLEGILPICCFCKKIRDDAQQWQELETYIARRTDADFSHGICPTCVVANYGDLTLEED